MSLTLSTTNTVSQEPPPSDHGEQEEEKQGVEAEKEGSVPTDWVSCCILLCFLAWVAFSVVLNFAMLREHIPGLDSALSNDTVTFPVQIHLEVVLVSGSEGGNSEASWRTWLDRRTDSFNWGRTNLKRTLDRSADGSLKIDWQMYYDAQVRSVSGGTLSDDWSRLFTTPECMSTHSSNPNPLPLCAPLPVKSQWIDTLDRNGTCEGREESGHFSVYLIASDRLCEVDHSTWFVHSQRVAWMALPCPGEGTTHPPTGMPLTHSSTLHD